MKTPNQLPFYLALAAGIFFSGVLGYGVRLRERALAWGEGPVAAVSRQETAGGESWVALAAALALTSLVAGYFWQREVRAGHRLEEMNRLLALERERRRAVEAELHHARTGLEARVSERTAPLEETNRALQNEIKMRIEAEAAAESSSQAKSEFLAIVSHEIRSPVGGMMRLLSLMLEENEEGSSSELRLLYDAAESLYRMADELLSWARADAVGTELQVATIRLAPFLRDLQSLFQPTAQIKKLDFHLVVAPQASPAFRSDPLPLRQILANLLANAFKFTARGGVTFSVGVGPEPAAGKIRLLFTVADSGIGLAPEKLDGLFEPCRQIRASTRRKDAGSGLGLSISSRLAGLLGGKIRVESQPGIGSTFVLELDVEPAPEDDSAL